MEPTFETRYRCRIIDYTSGLELLDRLYYPGACSSGGADGLLLEVTPEDRPRWIGQFAFGRISPKSITAIYPTARREILCVISRGEGYLVNTRDPTEWKPVACQPIMHLLVSVKHGLLVFGDYTHLVAYSGFEARWVSDRLAWDGMRVALATEDTIESEFEEPSSGEKRRFVVDANTGLLIMGESL